jgi:hypothetical protein
MKAFGQTGKCVYEVKVGGKVYSNGIRYCDKPTKFTIAKDDNDNKYRKYDHLCPEHREIIDKYNKEYPEKEE